MLLMDEQTKEELISQFSIYLDNYQIPKNEQNIDLFSLFTELAALRNEIKLESRQVKTALDIFKSSFEIMESSHEQLNQELNHCHSEQETKINAARKLLLLDILDIYDRLEAGTMVLNNYQPSSWTLFCNREINFIQRLQEGQTITLRKLEQLLTQYQVKTIETVNKPFNPHNMCAVETDSQLNVADGIVTCELRKGFIWQNKVLRLANVKVNKKNIVTLLN